MHFTKIILHKNENWSFQLSRRKMREREEFEWDTNYATQMYTDRGLNPCSNVHYNVGNIPF